MRRWRLRAGWLWWWLMALAAPLAAQQGVVELCPAAGIVARSSDFQPGGIILTAFDSAALWVYDIDRNTRYPLPETVPCTTNCRLSPDAAWITYLEPRTLVFHKMRLTGTERTAIAGEAADVLWWNPTTLLVWTPDHRAYLQVEGTAAETRQFLPVAQSVSVQPGGYWAVGLDWQNELFQRVLVNLEPRLAAGGRPPADETRISLAPDTPYFNQQAWSPDGRWLAYVGRGAVDARIGSAGAEIFFIQPGSAIPEQGTFFSQTGAVRLGGLAPGSLSWSPDGTRLAFWAMPLNGPDPATNAGAATLYLLDMATRRLTRYCGYSTAEHTPNPPRLAWSPDGTHIAFAGNVAGDARGALLLALNVADGTLTELSVGIAPALGRPDVYAWGRRP